MTRYKLIYLIWLLPAYLLFLALHQVAVYDSLTDTYHNGSIHTAEVVEFDIKQIASQTNGYVVLSFDADGSRLSRRLSLPIELAALIQDLTVIPIRYSPEAFQQIVMIPTYEKHKNMVVSNIAMAGLGMMIALGVAIFTHRFARRKLQEEERELVIEKIDSE